MKMIDAENRRKAKPAKMTNPMDRYLDEVLTGNRDINKCAWCKKCIFRDKSDDLGPVKCYCGVYDWDNPKPLTVVLDNIRCDFFERDPNVPDDD